MADLEKQLQVLRKKLERSERHRAAIEELHDRDKLMYKMLHAEVSAAREAVEKSNLELKKTQAQLVQQEKLASLGELTAGIAHEIKNPLNFINNFAEVNAELAQELRETLQAGEDVGDLADLVDDIEQNAHRIRDHGKRVDGIVKGMMRHASGGSGERNPTDVNDMVRQNADLAYHGKRAQMPDLNVDVRYDLDNDAGLVDMVPEEIGRVLLNLIGNAFDAVYEYATTMKAEHASETSAEYAPAMTVSTRRLAGEIEIRVSDNGPGISP
ncbi:MAG: sensor histidine kinase, partial [Rhodothermia bacterium]